MRDAQGVGKGSWNAKEQGAQKRMLSRQWTEKRRLQRKGRKELL